MIRTLQRREPVDTDAIRRAYPLPDEVAKVAKLTKAGKEFVALCPFHAEKTPSFTVYIAADGKWRCRCFGACGWGGDVVDFVGRYYGLAFLDAVAQLTGGELQSRQNVANESALPAANDDHDDRIEQALAIWDAAGPIAGSLGETYFRSRCIDCRLPPTLRFAWLPYGVTGLLHPAVVAAVQDAFGRITGVHRIFLNATGTGKLDVRKPKLSRGKIAGSAIRLAPPSEALIVAEGIEDALSLQQELEFPVWAAGGAGMLDRMQFPGAVRTVSVGGDADEPGKVAALKAAKAFASRGLRTRVFFPTGGAKDFNQALSESRK